MTERQNGVGHTRRSAATIRRRIDHAVALALIPAIVAANLAQVDLFPSALSYIINMPFVSSVLKGHAKGIAQAARDHLLTRHTALA